MEVFPELYSQRLKLRRIQSEDIPALVKYANNKKISDQIINIPFPYQEMDAIMRLSYVVQGFKSKTRLVFAITLKEQAELIGEISLHLENDKTISQLGYWVGEPFWNQGIGSEAVAAIVKFGFEKLNLRLVYATCHAENTASQKVLLKNGMAEHSINGNVIQYRLTREKFEAFLPTHEDK